MRQDILKKSIDCSEIALMPMCRVRVRVCSANSNILNSARWGSQLHQRQHCSFCIRGPESSVILLFICCTFNIVAVILYIARFNFVWPQSLNSLSHTLPHETRPRQARGQRALVVQTASGNLQSHWGREGRNK